jgi:hypothetical protein
MVGAPMNYPRKRLLLFSLLAGLLTILFLISASGFNSSSSGTLESSLTLDIIEAQSAAPIESPPEDQLEVPDFTQDKPAPSLEITLDRPLSGDTNLSTSSVTLDTYVPVANAAVTPTANGAVPPTIKPASPQPKVSIPVLNYHSVTIDPGNVVVISPAKLEEQMTYLHEHGYTPVSLATFISLMEGDGSATAPEKPVLLTFDDGYIDNYEEAMPLLAKYSFPATLFISPGMTDQDGYLNWEQIKKLHEAGWDIQPHGMTHPHLPKLSADQQAYEILEARKQIEEQLGSKVSLLS